MSANRFVFPKYSAVPIVTGKICDSSTQEKVAPLINRTLAAFAWQFISASSMFIFQTIVIVILARLLPVEAFGLLAQAMIVIGSASVISDIGVGPALIQLKELTETHIKVGFTLSIGVGLLLTSIFWVLAPSAARIFRTSELTPVVQLLSLTFLVSGFGSVAAALMRRRLDFRKIFYADLISLTLGYAVVGVTLGLLDYGVWALSWAALSQTVLKSVILFIVSPHTVRFSFAVTEAQELLRFGFGMSLARLANYAARNGDYFIVGRYLGIAPLGLYARAYQLMVLPISEFASIVSNVLFCAYSEIQNETDRLKSAYLKSLSVSSIALFPVLAGMAIAAPEIVRGVFGPKWSGATVSLQLLCIGGLFRAIYNPGDALVRAKGAVYAQFWRHFIYATAVIICAGAGTRWGIEGVAIGVDISLLIMYLITAQLSLKLLNCSWREFLLFQIPGVVLSCVVVSVALPVTLMLRTTNLHDLIKLSCTILTSGLTLIIAGMLLPDAWLGGFRHWLVIQVQRARSRLSCA